MSYPIHIVDVFTDQALAGNQLAVVLDAGDIPLTSCSGWLAR